MPRTAAATHAVHDLLWGIERETHRIQQDGSLSRGPHPAALVAPAFTRDFAETQLEIVTPPRHSVDLVLGSLRRLTDEARRAVAPELLWPFSMPPRLPADEEIRVADFGTDERSRRARLYREGLARRYGKARQMICGVHANVSFRQALESAVSRQAPLEGSERAGERASDALYLRLARNLYEDLPVLVLLTGASPVRGDAAPAEPVAISHRNGSLGYGRGEFQPYLDLSSLEAYLSGIRRGLRTESSAFSELGLVRDGHVVQLNAHVFQTEKEFYAPLRLRQTLLPGESTQSALEKRGIGYLELRFLDVDPWSPVGVAAETLRLLQLFVLDGLHRPSPPRSSARLAADLQASGLVALRDPRALVPGDPALVSAERRLAALAPWAERRDGGAEGAYAASLRRFQKLLAHPATHPAAVLARRLGASGADWTSFGVSLARAQVRSAHRENAGAEDAHHERQGARHAVDDARL